MTARLLIVEAERSLQEMLARLFEAEGFSVRAVGTGEEALVAVAEEEPELVLLDATLPGLSGVEVCRILRAQPGTRLVTIMLHIAGGEDCDRDQGLATGADEYVQKPISARQLIARVKRTLNRTNPNAVADLLESGGIRIDRRTFRVLAEVRGIGYALRPSAAGPAADPEASE